MAKKYKYLTIFNYSFFYLTIQKMNAIVQFMNYNNRDNEEHFEILRKISKKPESSQRQLAKELGISLGKLNYCLKELRAKGLIKIENFKKNPNKLNYIYVLTPKGITEKTKLTLNFMKRKMAEYDELKAELKKNKNVDNNKI